MYLPFLTLLFCLPISSSTKAVGINVNFFNEYYFVLSSNANESFGFSMTPFKKNGIVSLYVGAPRSSNNMPIKGGAWLGGLFECNLDGLSCGINQIVNLDLGDWSISNLGFSIASSFYSRGGGSGKMGSGSGESDNVAVCDPRARLTSSQGIDGIGLCFLLRPDHPSAGSLSQGAVTFMPKLIRNHLTPMPNMLFGSSVASLPDASGSAYAFGFPYLLLGFGGTAFMSAFNESRLSSTVSSTSNSEVRRPPVTFWGHSYTGGFESSYADLQRKSHETTVAGAQLDSFYRRLLHYKVRSYSCAGFAIATSDRLFGTGGASDGTFDLAEGAPCPPEPMIQSVSFDRDFMADYQASFEAEASENARQFSGVVRLYRVAGSAAEQCRREGSGDRFDTINCFPDSVLRSTLRGPGSFGGRFGHALLLVDLNADGWDDLVVSAPADLSAKRDSGAFWTLGAIYVYMNGGHGRFIADNANATYRLSFPSCEDVLDRAEAQTRLPNSDQQQQQQLVRLCNSARQFEIRFGWSLARLGDVDRDGFEDFAVGAPLAGGGGGGAVAVFKGGRDGAPRLGQLVANAEAAGFGESVSPGADFDASGRPDLVVAAPRQDSGKVYFYPSRYVVQFDLKVVDAQPVKIPQTRLADVQLRVLLNRTILGPALPPGSSLAYSLRVQFFIDTWPGLARPRFQLLDLEPNNTLVVTKSTAEHFTLRLAYDQKLLLNNEADLTSPLQIEAVWKADPSNPGPPGTVPKAARSALLAAPHLQGLRHADGERFLLQSIPWDHGCAGIRCLTRLTVTCQSNATRDPASQEPELLITDDSDRALELLCRVASDGEPAYNVYLRLQFDSAALALVGGAVQSGVGAGFQSVTVSSAQDKVLLGSLVASETQVRLLFKPQSVRCDIGSVNFQFTVITSSELTPDSAATWKSQLRVRTVLSISMQAEFSASLGYQNQTLLGFNAFQGSLYKLTSPRRLPELYVTLANRAAAYLPSSYLLIHWPIETAPLPGEVHGKYLMYLQTAPYIQHTAASAGSGDRRRTSVTCNAAQLEAIRNPLRLKPDDVDSCRQSGRSKLLDYSLVNVSDSVRLDNLPPPLLANRTNPSDRCSRQHRFDYTYSCANSRCLPLLCQLGELSSRVEPLQLTFATVAYQFTFIEDNLMCSSVSIVPSVQWLPGPEFAGRVLIRQSDQSALTPVLQSFNSGKPPPEEMDILMRILIYGGASLLGAFILGLLILLLAMCTPFFKRRRGQQQQPGGAAGSGNGGGGAVGGGQRLLAAGVTGAPLQSKYRYDEDDFSYYQ